MKIDIPDGVIEFSKEFSRYKTPAVRTQGWKEQPHEQRGEGDMLDTLGSLMLWRYLVQNNVPVTYLLTGRQGDDADLQVKFKRPEREKPLLDINVKTSKFDWEKQKDPCKPGHLAIKEVEFNKSVFDVYAQVFVHLNTSEKPHIHICGWIGRKDEAFERQKVRVIPGTPDVLGFWIPCGDLQPMEAFLKHVKLR